MSLQCASKKFLICCVFLSSSSSSNKNCFFYSENWKQCKCVIVCVLFIWFYCAFYFIWLLLFVIQLFSLFLFPSGSRCFALCFKAHSHTKSHFRKHNRVEGSFGVFFFEIINNGYIESWTPLHLNCECHEKCIVVVECGALYMVMEYSNNIYFFYLKHRHNKFTWF